jgi:hypothetical protein
MLLEAYLPAGVTVERVWPIALGVLFIAYLIKEIRSYRRLSHFPTPSWICGISSLWEYQVEMSGRNYAYWEEACEKYGQHPPPPFCRLDWTSLMTLACR